ncbi:glycosyltransferase family A protein [Clostridium perfringens]|nr:glycosyltransferase family A protein [Clostridium perfringens]MDM0937431.1 glycosyltransferase family A protein [Clostridium perfringens]
MCKISVVTPTYNRANFLENLYTSLQKQEFKNFEWLIIDDGSIDNTKDIVKKLINNLDMNIRYIYKENGGKHSALNIAIDNCKGELFFIVDSDDIVINGALYKIVNTYELLENKEEFCGIAGFRKDHNGNLLSNSINKDFVIANSIEAFYNLNLKGDKAEVFFTKILKKYKFPIFGDEKFLTEATLWNKIANDGYLIKWIKEVFIEGEYIEGGLTKNSLNLFLNNSKGNLYYLNQESSYNIPIRYKIKCQANYFRYGILAKNKLRNLIKESNLKYFSIITLPLGILGVFYTKFKLLKK